MVAKYNKSFDFIQPTFQSIFYIILLMINKFGWDNHGLSNLTLFLDNSTCIKKYHYWETQDPGWQIILQLNSVLLKWVEAFLLRGKGVMMKQWSLPACLLLIVTKQAELLWCMNQLHTCAGVLKGKFPNCEFWANRNS